MIAFKPELEKIKLARDHVAEIAAGWPVDEYHVRLVTSELVTNAIRHASTDEVRVDAYADEDARESVYVVEVWDADGKAPVPALCCPCTEAFGGRGLWVVMDLADRWGVHHDHDDGGKVVYAEWSRP